MENIQQILQHLNPKKLEEVLKAYVLTWQKQVQMPDLRTPNLGIVLINGQYIEGELIQVDFKMEMLCIRLEKDTSHLDVGFIPFNQVSTFNLLALENCQVFVEELAIL